MKTNSKKHSNAVKNLQLNLKIYIENSGRSIAAIAEDLGTSRQYIHRILNDKNIDPPLSTLCLFAHYLKKDLTELLDE